LIGNPGILGTWVHTMFSNYLRGLGLGYEANTGLEGWFNGRPDVILEDPSGEGGHVWELKPFSYLHGKKRQAALDQLSKYCTMHNGFTPGNSRRVIPNKFSLTFFYYDLGDIEITFYPDPVDPNSGLLFYDLWKTIDAIQKLSDAWQSTHSAPWVLPGFRSKWKPAD
jgi:hypothetical protein